MSESKEQHMKTPWILGGSAAWSEAAKDRGPIFICDIREGTHVPVGTNQANARFIVRAVNSHDALVEALKRSQDWMNEPMGGHLLHERFDEKTECESDCLRCAVKAAISLAEA